MSSIPATYQNGVFKPKQPVSLPEGCEVTVETIDTERPDGMSALEREIRWLTTRTPEAIARAREEIFSNSRPPRSIPEGKTLSDMIRGQWPGEETDEEVHDALEQLS